MDEEGGGWVDRKQVWFGRSHAPESLRGGCAAGANGWHSGQRTVPPIQRNAGLICLELLHPIRPN